MGYLGLRPVEESFCLEPFDAADQHSGRVYLQIEDGRPVWVDAEAIASAVSDPHTRAGVLAVAPGVLDRPATPSQAPLHVDDLLPPNRIRTLGSWGRP